MRGRFQTVHPESSSIGRASERLIVQERSKRKMVDDWWPLLSACERKVLWLASWTIHHANHLRDNVDGLKVGGHQASSASVAAIMTALYFHTLRPADRVAVKPHAVPIYHAIQYLLRRQTREKLEGFRGYKGAQSYRRAPRTATTSISRPVRWAWAWRRRCFPRWCRIMSARMAGASIAPKAA